MDILIIVLFNIIVYLRTLRFSIIVDDIRYYEEISRIKDTPLYWRGFLYLFRGIKRRLYGGATFGVNNIALDHAISILLHTCICVLIYMVFGYNEISFFAALLYSCNPVNHSTAIWLNGRRYAISIIIVLLMMLYAPWGMLLYPLTFMNNQLIAVFSPLLVKGINAYIYSAIFIPILILCNYKKIKAKIKFRMDHILCKEQKEYRINRIIIIIKSYGFYFFNMLIPVRVMINYPDLFWWGIDPEKNKKCYDYNAEFFRGIFAALVSIYGIIYLHGYMQTMWIFMLLSILQWSAVFSAVQVNADRYISLSNVFMMFFLASLISMSPYSITIYLCIIVYYLTQLSICMRMYQSIDEYQRYQLFYAPNITKPRFNRIEFYLAQKRYLTAWYLIEEGLQNMPNDFHFLLQAAVCLANVGNVDQALEMVYKAKNNFYMGQESIQGNMANSIEKQLVEAKRKMSEFEPDTRPNPKLR